MTDDGPDSNGDLLESVHDKFIEPARARLHEYTPLIREGMSNQHEYDDTLQYVLGGIGAKQDVRVGGKTIVDLLWAMLEHYSHPVESIRWLALQTFSNMHGGPSGQSMWTPRKVAADYMAKSDREGRGEFKPYVPYLYNQVNSKWYFTSTRQRDKDPDRPVGFYNLLMNPRFYDPFKNDSTIQWYPQPLLVTRGAGSQDEKCILPTLQLDCLVEALGGEGTLDDLRRQLYGLVLGFGQELGLSDAPEWEQIGQEVVTAYHRCIQNFFSTTEMNCLNDAVDKIKRQLVAIYRRSDSTSLDSGSWRKLDNRVEEATDQLQTKISTVSLASTFLYWLLQDAQWNYYYYFVFGSTPNTSGPSLGIATTAPLSRQLQISSNWMLNALGKDLAMLETQVLAAEFATRRTEARFSYFTHLYTHTFTKAFITPIDNEMSRLRSSMNDSYEEESIARTRETLRRFEYAMQSGQYWGVGAAEEDNLEMDLVPLEAIDSVLLKQLMGQLGKSINQVVNRRLNDLFDDPHYALELDAIDPSHAGGPKIDVDLKKIPSVAFHADFALLAYHLQSLIQNAAEAINLVSARSEPQKISFECEKEAKDGREYIVFAVGNTGGANQAAMNRLTELEKGLAALDESLQKNEFDSKQLPPSRKSGGHQGMGLILAAVFCNSIRIYNDERFDDGPKAFGKLELLPPGKKDVLTWFTLRIPLCSEGEVVRIDRRLFEKLPTGEIERKKEVQADGSGVSSVEGRSLAKVVRADRPVRVLVVDDDTADRQRFRFNIRRMLYRRIMSAPNVSGTTPGMNTSGSDDDGMSTDNCLFNELVVFAWDAEFGAVSSYKSIFHFLTRGQRSEPITVFLDLAWNRKEEVFFDRLRRIPTSEEYRKAIDGADEDKPAAFKLLQELSKCSPEEREMIQIFVVTAYKQPNLVRYLENCYPDMKIRSFMKWSDEPRLCGIIGPTL